MSELAFWHYCDHCGLQAERVYDEFATCRECEAEVCPDCSHPGTDRGPDGATDGITPHTIECKHCTVTDDACTGPDYHDANPGDVCRRCGYRTLEEDTRDPDYERAAAHARATDFEDTGGEDWT